MLATISAWLATQGVSLALGFLASVLKDAWATYQANKAQRDLGASETAATINKETADAERRAASAAINAPDRARVTDDADQGKF